MFKAFFSVKILATDLVIGKFKYLTVDSPRGHGWGKIFDLEFVRSNSFGEM